MNPSRRGLITGLVSLVAAPAVVRASSLMPVKLVDFTPTYSFGLPPLKEEGASVLYDQHVNLAAIRSILLPGLNQSVYETGQLEQMLLAFSRVAK